MSRFIDARGRVLWLSLKVKNPTAKLAVAKRDRVLFDRDEKCGVPRGWSLEA